MRVTGLTLLGEQMPGMQSAAMTLLVPVGFLEATRYLPQIGRPQTVQCSPVSRSGWR